MDRREFLRAAAAAISLGCSCQVGAVGWPKSDEKAGNANRSEGGWPGAGQSSPKKNGGGDTFSFDRACALSHAEAQSFRDSVRLLQSTGWPFIDQLFALETRVLGDVTSLRPGFAFFDDSAGPNAFATNATFLGSNHGSVCFGVQLLKMEQEEQSFAWEGAAVFIMAHEWAHITQFNTGARGRTVQMELLADFVAGWYLGWKTALGSRFDAQGAARSVFSKGDFNFNSQGHHGTPQQRLQAATTGWNFAQRGLLNYGAAFNQGRALFGI